MHRSVGYFEALDEFIFLIRIDMVLVPEVAFIVLFRPARVDVFLPQLGFGFRGLPFVWRLAFLDLRVFVAAITLSRRFHKRRVDHLTFARYITLPSQLLMESQEQRIDQSRKRMNDRRSRIWYSMRSSERLCNC